MAQASNTNPKVRLPYECLITKLIVAVSVSPIKENGIVKYMSDFDRGTIYRSSNQTTKNQNAHEVWPSGAVNILGDDKFENLDEP